MDEKQYILYLRSINYTGDNIGRDLIFSITLSGYGYKKVEFEKKINQGQLVAYPSFVVYEQRINRSFIQGMVVSIVEDDLYDDRGSAVTRTPIPFEAGKKDIQVKVQVKGDDIGDSKKEAEIILNFEAEVIDLRREEEDGEDPGQPGGEPVPYPGLETLIKLSPHPILAFVSDLHIGADRCVDDFDGTDDGEFVAMLRYLQAVLNSSGSKRMELVILGDFLELWETRNYPTSIDQASERIAKAKFKIDKIAGKHAGVFAALKAFAEAEGVTVHYLYGNHDDEIIDPQVRTYLRDRTQVPFSFGDGGQAKSYTNRQLKVFARHGHQDDRYNFTSDPFDHRKKPLGRWIVEQFVTRLELSADAQCRSPFANIDAFVPLSQYDDYVVCLRKNGSLPDVRFQDILAAAENLSDNAPAGIGAKVSKAVIEPFLTLARQDALDKFAIFKGIAEAFKLGDVTTKDARKLRKEVEGDPRCILFGHTHAEEITPLGGDSYYVNTGAWQDKQAANEGNPCAPLVLPNRHLTLLVRMDQEDLELPGSSESRVFIYMLTFPGPAMRFGQPVNYRLS